jgi:biopolymer transport protein ExbD
MKATIRHSVTSMLIACSLGCSGPARVAQPSAERTVDIELTANGTVILHEQEWPVDQLPIMLLKEKSRLAAAEVRPGEAVVHIKANDESTYGAFNQVVIKSQESAFERFVLLISLSHCLQLPR